MGPDFPWYLHLVFSLIVDFKVNTFWLWLLSLERGILSRVDFQSNSISLQSLSFFLKILSQFSCTGENVFL